MLGMIFCKQLQLHWLISSEFIPVKKIFAVKIHCSELGDFTAFMSIKKEIFWETLYFCYRFGIFEYFLLLFGLDLVIWPLMPWFFKIDFLKMKDFHLSNWVIFTIYWNTDNMFWLVPIKTIKNEFFLFGNSMLFEIFMASSQWKKVLWISQSSCSLV